MYIHVTLLSTTSDIHMVMHKNIQSKQYIKSFLGTQSYDIRIKNVQNYYTQITDHL